MKSRIWKYLLLVCCLATCPAPDISAHNNAPDNEFNVLIVDVSWLFQSGRPTGDGHGDFMNSDGHWQGFTFTADCGSRFSASDDIDDVVTGKWKKEMTRMTILLQEIGGKKISKCELRVTIRDDDKLYGRPGLVLHK